MALDSLHSIAVFVRVAETLSFTEAARQLGITPSGASRAVSRLEVKVGVQLIKRSTRRIYLTPEGEALLEGSRQVLAEIELAEATLMQRLASPSGRLRMVMPIGFGRTVVLPLLREFREHYPELTLDIELTDRRADVAAEDIDVSLRLGTLADSRIVARSLGSFGYVVVASPAYLRLHGEPRTLDDLDAHRCSAYYEPAGGRYRPWEFAAPIGSKSVQGAININNPQALLDLATSGTGLVAIAKYLAADGLRRGELVQVLSGFEPVRIPVWLTYAERRYQMPRVRALVEFLTTRAAAVLDQLSR